MFSFINEFISNDLTPKDKEYIIDMSLLTFIEPGGVTVLSNLFEWLKKREVIIYITYDKHITSPIKYLDDSEFFKRYIGRCIVENSKLRESTLPLTIIKYSDSCDWINNILIRWLTRELSTKNEQPFQEIITCMYELFNNIIDHSSEESGCIFVQHYPRRNEIMIAISDFGIGIPGNVKKIFPEYEDHELLLKSIEEGFTTKATSKNRGAGLDILYNNVIKNNKGKIYLCSGSGVLESRYDFNCSCKMNKKAYSVKNYFYPGTFFQITLNTNYYKNYEYDNGDFKWI